MSTTKKKPVASKVTAKKTAERPGKASQDEAVKVQYAQVGVNVGTTKNSADFVILDLPTDKIVIDPDFNPRSGGPGDVSDLTASVKRHGLQHFPAVRPCKEAAKTGAYELVTGERRVVVMGELGMATVPVLVKPGLEGKDDEALAYAMAENSEGNRHNLNAVETGRASARLRDGNSWTPMKIARETGIGHQTVRRCLTLIDGPKDVIAKVEKGELTFSAGVELAKLPTATYKQIGDDAIGKGASAAQVREIAKKAAKDTTGKGNAPTKGADAKKHASVTQQTTWRTARAKQAMLRFLCHRYANDTDADEVGTPVWHGIRGAISALFYDRGDRPQPLPPMPGKATKQELKAFEDAIKDDAAKYQPPKVVAK